MADTVSELSRAKRAAIWAFVVLWNLLFLYETFRAFHLTPLVQKLRDTWSLAIPARELPKLPLLFPPAGWIMFYRVDNSSGGMEIYGVRKGTTTLIDPHRVFSTRYVLFDNIRRGMMFSAAEPARRWAFCNFLRRKFPEFEDFAVTQYQYQDLAGAKPPQRLQGVLYQCKLF